VGRGDLFGCPRRAFHLALRLWGSGTWSGAGC